MSTMGRLSTRYKGWPGEMVAPTAGSCGVGPVYVVDDGIGRCVLDGASGKDTGGQIGSDDTGG